MRLDTQSSDWHSTVNETAMMLGILLQLWYNGARTQ